MNDAQLLRYSRHILLDQIGIDGQQRLLDARVLIVGAGGLGSPAALYLASAGVGAITLCDGDTVEPSNLQRQIAHDTSQIGRNKAASAAQRMQAMNPDTRIEVVPERLDGAQLATRVQQADVVLDCSDNFPTRQALNRACIAARKPLVSGAGIRFEGQVSVFDLRRNDAPCYACLFPEDAEDPDTTCAEFGVFAPLVGVIGSLQAAEALKLLIGTGTSLAGRLLRYDALSAQWRETRLARDPGCPACAVRA